MKKIIALFLCLSFTVLMPLQTLAISQIEAGAKIPLIYVGEKTSSKNLRSGDRVQAEVLNDVIVNNRVVFRQGAPATLNVADARKARFWGNPGEMLLINGSVQDVTGKYRSVEFTYRITGEEKTWPKVMGCISIFFLFPLALCGFVKGGQAELLPQKVIYTTLLSNFSI